MSIVLAKRSVPEKVYPFNANSSQWSYGTGGVYTNWAQIVGTLANELLLCGANLMEGIVISTNISGTTSWGYNNLIEIGTGTGTANVSQVARFSTGYTQNYQAGAGTGNQEIIGGGRTFRFAPVLIGTGVNIYHRNTSTQSTAPSMVAGMYIIGYEPNATGIPIEVPFPDPHKYVKGQTSVYSNYYPSGTNQVGTNGTSSWIYGAATQIIGTAANDMLIKSMSCIAGESTYVFSRYASVQFGIGASGSEEWLAEVPLPNRVSIAAYSGEYQLIRPLVLKKGERLSMRFKGSNQNDTFKVVVNVDEVK